MVRVVRVTRLVKHVSTADCGSYLNMTEDEMVRYEKDLEMEDVWELMTDGSAELVETTVEVIEDTESTESTESTEEDADNA